MGDVTQCLPASAGHAVDDLLEDGRGRREIESRMPAPGQTELVSGRESDACMFEQELGGLDVESQVAAIEPGEIAGLRLRARNPTTRHRQAMDVVIAQSLQMPHAGVEPCFTRIRPRGE